jgi:hypothetical protein
MTEKILCGKCDKLLYFGLFSGTIKISAPGAVINYRWIP